MLTDELTIQSWLPLQSQSAREIVWGGEIAGVSDERDMVTMGSPYSHLGKPDVDWARAREDAVAYCVDWKGMSQVEPVGTTRRECLSRMGGDCARYAIVGDYQCVKKRKLTLSLYSFWI